MLNSSAQKDNQRDREILLDEIADVLTEKDFLYLKSTQVIELLSNMAGSRIGNDQLFLDSWDRLEEDQYMADGGRYRKRRHAIFAIQSASETPALMPCQPHYQTLDYNTLNGGIARYFAPILLDLLNSRSLAALLEFGARLFSQVSANASWHIELHQFRIEARDGQKGSPTPEGVHRDGVDFVIVVMIKRVNIESGATSIYNLDNQLVGEFTLQETFDMAIVNDKKVYHGVTPITQLDPNEDAYRDVLVITFRQKQS
ncbi:MAG: 2OG-Fe dioxygenase family protein [Gammaproteobacteria bacterium]|nr:2OG-Fe dioxygenase family protein [Gammaproteobacteria bacterium]